MQSVPVLCALSLLLEAPRSSSDLSSRTAAEEWGGCLVLVCFSFWGGGVFCQMSPVSPVPLHVVPSLKKCICQLCTCGYVKEAGGRSLE